jgi:hypothetical protein
MLKLHHYAAEAMPQNMKPCFIEAPGPRTDHIGKVLSNSGSFELKVPGCGCRAPSFEFYIPGGTYAKKDALCPCTISPCAADALE